jgi:hypothetical protein
VNHEDRIFQKPEGLGWFVLAGQLPSQSGDVPELVDRILSKIDLSLLPHCLFMPPKDSLQGLAFINEIGMLLELEVLFHNLEEAEGHRFDQASVLFLAGGEAHDWVHYLQDSLLSQELKAFLFRGGLLFASDSAASAMGEWVIEPSGKSHQAGLGWIKGAIILPWIEDPAESSRVRDLLTSDDPYYAIGLSEGRMLATGPANQVEIWGSHAPTILLGSGWRKPSERPENSS